jgi:hypothetical protein
LCEYALRIYGVAKAAGDIYVEKGQVTIKVYALGFFKSRLDPEIQVSASERRPFRT